MTDVYERYYVDLEWGEEYRGVYLVRGENVVLVGELVRRELSYVPVLIVRLYYIYNHNHNIIHYSQDEEEFQAISKRMAKFKRPLEVILPKFKALMKKVGETRMRLDQLGLSELIENDNY